MSELWNRGGRGSGVLCRMWNSAQINTYEEGDKMFCTKCGKQIEDGSRFCPYCGMPQGKTGDLSEGQKIPNIHRMSNASHVPHTPSEPNVQNTSKASARAIENFIIKFMAADWANKVYFILAVIFSVRIDEILTQETLVLPWTIK